MGIKNRFYSVFYFEGRLKLFRRPLVYRVYIKAETQTITRVLAFLILLPTFDFCIKKIYH